jgi:hypothetical protein
MKFKPNRSKKSDSPVVPCCDTFDDFSQSAEEGFNAYIHMFCAEETMIPVHTPHQAESQRRGNKDQIEERSLVALEKCRDKFLQDISLLTITEFQKEN